MVKANGDWLLTQGLNLLVKPVGKVGLRRKENRKNTFLALFALTKIIFLAKL